MNKAKFVNVGKITSELVIALVILFSFALLVDIGTQRKEKRQGTVAGHIYTSSDKGPYRVQQKEVAPKIPGQKNSYSVPVNMYQEHLIVRGSASAKEILVPCDGDAQQADLPTGATATYSVSKGRLTGFEYSSTCLQ